jgi:hypothetical protein
MEVFVRDMPLAAGVERSERAVVTDRGARSDVTTNRFLERALR